MEEEKEVAPMAAAFDAEAVRYVLTVRDSHPAKYGQFLRIMDDHRKQRIGLAEVASRMKELFRDSPGLIAGFSAFLPESYKIEVGADELNAYFVRDPKEEEENRVKIQKATRYVQTVRASLEKTTRYVQTVRAVPEKDNPAKYDEFLDVMADFKYNRIGTAEVASRVKTTE